MITILSRDHGPRTTDRQRILPYAITLPRRAVRTVVEAISRGPRNNGDRARRVPVALTCYLQRGRFRWHHGVTNYRDPAAPEANNLVPGGSVLVVEDRGPVGALGDRSQSLSSVAEPIEPVEELGQRIYNPLLLVAVAGCTIEP